MKVKHTMIVNNFRPAPGRVIVQIILIIRFCLMDRRNFFTSDDFFLNLRHYNDQGPQTPVSERYKDCSQSIKLFIFGFRLFIRYGFHWLLFRPCAVYKTNAMQHMLKTSFRYKWRRKVFRMAWIFDWWMMFKSFRCEMLRLKQDWLSTINGFFIGGSKATKYIKIILCYMYRSSVISLTFLFAPVFPSKTSSKFVEKYWFYSHVWRSNHTIIRGSSLIFEEN